MLINNIDISSFNSQLLKKDIQSCEVIIYDDWLRQSVNPLYLGKQETNKKLKIQLLIKAISDENCLVNIGNLIKQFEKCIIKFDDLSFYYDCVIASKSHERIKTGVYTLDIELKSGYAYKTDVIEILSHVSSKTINVQGSLPSPAIVTITMVLDTISLNITGFGSDIIIIKNLKANIPVIIDSELCKVTSNGLNKFADTDFWEFPILKTGSNTIGVSNANSVISISYKPKFI